MKKVVLTLTIAAGLFGFVACGNDAPKTDLNEQEQAAVDSTLITDEAASDSLEAAIRAQIGARTLNPKNILEIERSFINLVRLFLCQLLIVNS